MITPRSYILGGNATFTLQNSLTGGRMTYRVRRPEPTTPHFVQVLTGPDNEASYTFLGTVFDQQRFHHSPKSPIGPDAPSLRGFDWLFRHLDELDRFPHVKFVPSGKCCRCGRRLTTPESVSDGYGPECKKLL